MTCQSQGNCFTVCDLRLQFFMMIGCWSWTLVHSFLYSRTRFILCSCRPGFLCPAFRSWSLPYMMISGIISRSLPLKPWPMIAYKRTACVLKPIASGWIMICGKKLDQLDDLKRSVTGRSIVSSCRLHSLIAFRAVCFFKETNTLYRHMIIHYNMYDNMYAQRKFPEKQTLTRFKKSHIPSRLWIS